MADITITTTVPSLRSSLPGQLTDFISERTSRKKRLTFSNFIISPIMQRIVRLNHKNVGRTGRNRTRNPRFWRPVLYQLNYCPATSIFQRLALFVICVFPAGGAEFLQLHSVRMLAFVACGRIITVFALFASQDDYISHRLLPIFTYSIMLDTTPLPMVCPPSRIAKRSPCSIAMGVIN